MQTVTFTREYRHQLDGLRTAIFPPGEIEVSNEVAVAANKAGALKALSLRREIIAPDDRRWRS